MRRECPVCEKPYEADPKRLAYGRQTTYSRKCSYDLRKRNLTKQITLPCAVCGEDVVRPPSHVKSKTGLVFCSGDCHYKGRGLGLSTRVVTKPYNVPDAVRLQFSEAQRERNHLRKAEGRYGHTEETKAKLSLATAKAIAEGRIPRVSEFERRVGETLRGLGINALSQHRFRGSQGRFAAVVDFYLPDRKLALEANGTFWHADPRVYPNGPEHPSQTRTLDKYTRKVKFLASVGVTVVEVWEQDFQSDPLAAVKAALAL